jgi:preprotein translocase subunit SecY
MLTIFSKKKILNIFNQNNPTKKILLTLVILFIFRFGNTIPLSGIDQDALKKSKTQYAN